MLQKIVLTAIFLIVTASIANAEQLKISITSPRDGASVSEKQVIKGKVSNPDAEVWVIIHPMIAGLGYWVQPSVTVDENGNWEVEAYIGVSGDSGKQFQIRAVANPKKRIKEGDILQKWPKAERRSKVIKVTRK